MSDKSAKNMREALIAELLGDMERLSQQQEEILARMEKTAAIINTASDKYYQAVQEFTEAAKEDLGKFYEARVQDVQQASAGEIRASMQLAAREAFGQEASIASREQGKAAEGLKQIVLQAIAPIKRLMIGIAAAGAIASTLAIVVVLKG